MQDPLFIAEVSSFSELEVEVCLGCYEVMLEEGIEPELASRNAVAAILQRRRLSAAPISPKQRRELSFWEQHFLKTMPPEEAEQASWARVLGKNVA